MTLPEDRNCESDWRKKLFLSDEFSDCEIIVKTPGYTPTRFPCHKAITSAASVVFEKMLQYAFQEGLSGKIIIDDNTTPSVMMIVLKFIYLDCVHLEDWYVARDVLKVAFKYKIILLIQKCANVLSENVTLSNVCYILHSAIACNLKGLMKFCLDVCDQACFVIVNTRAFQRSDQETLRSILSRPSIQVESEMMVYQAVWKWATYRCCLSNRHVTKENIAKEMLPLLDCIGFKFMSDDDINSIPKSAMEVFCKSDPKTSPNHEEGNSSKDLNNPNKSKISKLKLSIHPALSEKERRINFPFQLSKYCIRISLKPFSPFPYICLTGSATLLRFTVDSHVYLQDFVVIGKKKSLSRDKISSLHICGRNGTLASFHSLANESKNGASLSLFSKEEQTVCILVFKANGLLLFEAEEEYTLEVNRDKQCNLILPLMTLDSTQSKKIKFNISTRNCYGLRHMNIIPAF